MIRLRPVVALLLVATALSALGPRLGAQERSRAGVLVRSGDGEVREMCVFFDEDEITGAELLRRAGVEIVSEGSALGTAVCSIDGKGCGSDDCFCRYPTFWGYWTKDTDAPWRFSDVGASARTVKDGSLDGWSFGRDGKPAPPDVGIDEVCGGSEERATASASAREPAEPRPRPDYLPLAAFAALLALAATLAVIRRRRRRPSDT